MKIKRRQFLAAAGGAALAGCTPKEDPYALTKPKVEGAAGWHTYEERWISSACGQCPAGCGIRVRVVEGRAVKIEAHPTCPINVGGVGPKGQSGLQLLYSPDRIQGPLRNGKSVSWDEAIAEIAARLKEIRPEGLVVVDGEPRGMMPQLWERFLRAFGSPNHVDHRSMTDSGKLLATYYMQGVPEIPAYDWPQTRYILGFGASLFESWCQTIHFTWASSRLRRSMPGKRVKFVQVSPRYSVTASKADEWVPIRPATYGALALGLAHVLVREKMYDEAFVKERTTGFELFRDRILANYPVDKVAEITGVQAEAIERLAREMVEHKPAIALADGAAAAATNGLGTAMAIHALNALLGNVERPGGMLVQKTAPLAPWPELAAAAPAAPRLDGCGTPACPLGRSAVQRLPQAILKGEPYPAQALFLYKSNPVYSKPDGKAWREAIAKIPLVVSFSPLRDESTFGAHYVLPEPTYLERWEPVEPAPSIGIPILTMREPVVKPLHDTMPTGDVVIRLARALGLEAAFPWKDYRAAILARMRGGVDPRGLAEKGGWSKDSYAYDQPVKFEFFSTKIAEELKRLYPETGALDRHLDSVGVKTRGEDLCLPHWEPPDFAGDEKEYPFVLLPHRGIAYAEGGTRHLPWLREHPIHGRYAWRERIEVNPEDAKKLGVHAGDALKVETPAGSKLLTADLQAGIPPGTLGLPLGLGAWPPRPDDPETAGGYALLSNRGDPLAGIFAIQCTRARVRKERAE